MQTAPTPWHDAPHRESAPEIEAASRRHNRLFAVVCGALLIVPALVNLAVDPFRVYHDAWSRPYAHPERYLVPGLIRNVSVDYDAIMVGTSHSANFRPAVIDPALGWKSMRCTLDGSTIPEQLMVVRAAAESGRVRHVLWGIDHFATLDPPERAAASGKMPAYLYERSWRTPLQYLVSSETLHSSVRIFRGRGERDLARRGAWFEEQADRFGPGKAVEVFRSWLDYRLNSSGRPAPEIQDRNVAEIARVIHDNPDIEFVCLLPPVSILCALAECAGDAGVYSERLRFRQSLCDAVADLPNCRLYDFETNDEITHDLDLYKDPSHYNQDVSDWMINEIAADRWRVRRETFARNQSLLDRQVREFATAVSTPGHPDFERLDMHRLGIDPARLRRPQWAEADGPVRR